MEKKVAVVVGDYNRSYHLGNFPEQKALKLANRLGKFLSLKENNPRDYSGPQGIHGTWISVYVMPVYANRVETEKRDKSPVRKSNNED